MQYVKFTIAAIVHLLILTLVPTLPVLAQFAGGTGNEEDPYQVETLEQLQAIGDSSNLDKHYIQIADIDAAETSEWNDGLGFDPIGWFVDIDNNNLFTGSYEGNGYTITELHINRPDEDYIGLFGYVEGATLENIALENVSALGSQIVGGLVGDNAGNGKVIGSYVTGEVSGNSLVVGGLVGLNRGNGFKSDKNNRVIDSYAKVQVSGNDYVGGLVGFNRGEVSNSYAEGDVFGNSGIGGLVGYGDGELLFDSYASGTVSGTENVGGLVGYILFGEVHDSYATGAVSGDDNVGGLVGRHIYEGDGMSGSYATGNVSGNAGCIGGLVGRTSALLTNSHATGNVSGREFVGGLVGCSDVRIKYSYAAGDVSGDSIVGGLVGKSGNVRSSYATGAVSGGSDIGGLIGRNQNGDEVEQSYSISQVTGNENVGGLIGVNEGTTDTSYWDTISSSQSQAVGRGSAEGITGLTTEEMTGEAAYENMEGFDFEEIWKLTESYPALKWENMDSIPNSTSNEETAGMPDEYALEANYPNPFNPTTQISYSIPEQAHVRLDVYNALGQRVATLVNESKSPGRYEVTFDATHLSSGLYLYQLQTESHTESRQMMLIR